MPNIERSCRTCEFNFNGHCADARYGEKVFETSEPQKCWTCGPAYFDELIDMLPEADKEPYLNDPNTSVQDLIAHLEEGKPLHKRRRR